MKGILSVALGLAICLTAAELLLAQAPAGGDSAAGSQTKPASQSQKPATPPQPPAPSSANPFPEDTSSVPVMPSNSTSAVTEGYDNGALSAGLPLPSEDLDPVRSPDDPEPEAAGAQETDSSSSLSGLANLLPPAESDQPDKKRKLFVKEPTHQEASSKDIDVGIYYLQTKNWKGALSRFESALVLDPENPDVYWGLAESNRHLSNFADARANYAKVVEYDPDSRHGKDAKKALNEPEIANGKNAIQAAPAGMNTQK